MFIYWKGQSLRGSHKTDTISDPTISTATNQRYNINSKRIHLQYKSFTRVLWSRYFFHCLCKIISYQYSDTRYSSLNMNLNKTVASPEMARVSLARFSFTVAFDVRLKNQTFDAKHQIFRFEMNFIRYLISSARLRAWKNGWASNDYLASG